MNPDDYNPSRPGALPNWKFHITILRTGYPDISDFNIFRIYRTRNYSQRLCATPRAKLQPLNWCLGRVSATHLGNDGIVNYYCK